MVELLQRFIIGRFLRQLDLCFQAAAHHFRMRGIFLDKSHNSSHNYVEYVAFLLTLTSSNVFPGPFVLG
jgi:hypothetical protein